MTTTADAGLFRRSADRALSWVRNRMMRHPDRSQGVWERVRIDMNEIQPWVRPDCCCEAAAAFVLRHEITGNRGDLGTARNLLRYALRRQTLRGGFPFYEWAPAEVTVADPDKTGGSLVMWPNDNGKVLEILSRLSPWFPDLPIEAAVRRHADFLVATQRPEGFWEINGATYPGTCFVAWPVCGLTAAFGITGDPRLREAALRAVAYMKAHQKPGGRMRTTYEFDQMENWRPASSESAEALKAFAIAHRDLGEDCTAAAGGCAAFLLSLQHESGAILNCDDSCKGASEQEDGRLTDLVYTDGYALQALQLAAEVFGRPDLRIAATNLAEFLADIQCSGEDPRWDGAWRGSYNVFSREWQGRADQKNPLDEGGMWSVYTGWCVLPNVIGLYGETGQTLW